jgi:hypothetical protein
MPSSIRPPPEMWSAVTTFFASTEGCLKVAGETSVPRRRSVVTAARPAIVAQASRELRSVLPITER